MVRVPGSHPAARLRAHRGGRPRQPAGRPVPDPHCPVDPRWRDVVHGRPEWISVRGTADYKPVRGGRALAVERSPYCRGSIEVLTPAGLSCGCLTGGALGGGFGATVGREGTVVIGFNAAEEHAVWELHPGVLR